MELYKCTKCGFQIRKNSEPSECAYCGTRESMNKVESMDKILDGID